MRKNQTTSAKTAIKHNQEVRKATSNATIETRRDRDQKRHPVAKQAAALKAATPTVRQTTDKIRSAVSHLPRTSQRILQGVPPIQVIKDDSGLAPWQWIVIGMLLLTISDFAWFVIGWFARSMA